MWAALIVSWLCCMNTERFCDLRQLGDTKQWPSASRGVSTEALGDPGREPYGQWCGGRWNDSPIFPAISGPESIGRERNTPNLVGAGNQRDFLVGWVHRLGVHWCVACQRIVVAGRRLAWLACVLYLGTGLIGVGLLTSIPQSYDARIAWLVFVASDVETSARFGCHTSRLAHQPKITGGLQMSRTRVSER
jgi:hypothetical protein